MLNGLAGNDQILAFAGNDTILGGGATDTLNGGNGNDQIDGGVGADWLTGAARFDLFVFATSNTGIDTVTDFATVGDQQAFMAASFGGGLTAGGTLNTDLTGAGPKFIASDEPFAIVYAGSDGAFYYDTNDTRLFWDADGAGAGAAVHIANFAPSTQINAADFTVI
jgi:serralysin